MPYSDNSSKAFSLPVSPERIELRHDFAQAHKNLGELLGRRGQLKQAIIAYRRALSLRPDYEAAAAGLANALLSNQDLDSAISLCESTLARRPDFRDLYITLGCSYRDAGRTDDAIACYRRALADQPDPRIHSELLMMFHFHPAYGRRRLFEEHAKWNDAYARPLISSWRPHANSPIADRPLRIGYVAWHLGNHPLGRLLVPVFANHDRERFEVYCYCEVRDQDAVGDALYRGASVWRTIRGLSDEAVGEVVREDRIDILVDLNMHTLGNRLLVFARKPAPVQVTYLAYPSTTGLAAMDYRITDPYLRSPRHRRVCLLGENSPPAELVLVLSPTARGSAGQSAACSHQGTYSVRMPQQLCQGKRSRARAMVQVACPRAQFDPASTLLLRKRPSRRSASFSNAAALRPLAFTSPVAWSWTSILRTLSSRSTLPWTPSPMPAEPRPAARPLDGRARCPAFPGEAEPLLAEG